jgi:hypothetical protein
MFIATTGIDAGTDDYIAGVVVATQAVSKLQEKVPGALPQILFVFASSNFVHKMVLEGIRSVTGPNTVVVGATTAGEIITEGPSNRPSVAVMSFYSDSITFAASLAEDINSDSEKAGIEIGSALQQASGESLKLIMMFADSLKGNSSAVIRGILSQVGEDFPIVGGSAADNGNFLETKQFFQDTVVSDAVVGVGLAGNFKYSVGASHGWSVVGAPKTITEAEGTIIRTIDGNPAIELYAQYLGETLVHDLDDHVLGKVALSYPLGIRDTESNEMILRAPFSVTPDGAIVCGGEIVTGSSVQLMIGTKENVIAAAKKAAEMAMKDLSTEPQACFIFCGHVHRLLFAHQEDAKQEIDVIKSIIGSEVPIIGFYSYAEQAPIHSISSEVSKSSSKLLNQSIVVVLIAE